MTTALYTLDYTEIQALGHKSKLLEITKAAHKIKKNMFFLFLLNAVFCCRFDQNNSRLQLIIIMQTGKGNTSLRPDCLPGICRPSSK